MIRSLRRSRDKHVFHLPCLPEIHTSIIREFSTQEYLVCLVVFSAVYRTEVKIILIKGEEGF